MRKTYQNEEIDTSRPAVPEQANVALAELAGELREGLLALAVGTGLQVMAAIIESGRDCRVRAEGPGSWLINASHGSRSGPVDVVELAMWSRV